MEQRWTLLIYTVPSQPSRKRATVWRELKKLGAVYLRDGVAVLPAMPETTAALRRIAAAVAEFDGLATVVAAAQLDEQRSATLIAQCTAERAAEYAEAIREAETLLAYVAREAEHRAFTRDELATLERDVGKLTQWATQIRARDYFMAGPPGELTALFTRCERQLGALLATALNRP